MRKTILSGYACLARGPRIYIVNPLIHIQFNIYKHMSMNFIDSAVAICYNGFYERYFKLLQSKFKVLF